jgi:hypothetical protein
VLGNKSKKNVVNTLTLAEGDVRRLNHLPAYVRVRSGYAWITHNGKDIVLSPGEMAEFEPSRDMTVVTPIRTRIAGPLEIEIYEN